MNNHCCRHHHHHQMRLGKFLSKQIMDAMRSVFLLIIVTNLVNSRLLPSSNAAHRSQPTPSPSSLVIKDDPLFYNSRANYFDYLHHKKQQQQQNHRHHNQQQQQLVGGDILVDSLLSSTDNNIQSSHHHLYESPQPHRPSSHQQQQQQLVDSNIFNLIDKVTHIGVRTRCDSRIVQSDVLAKMRLLKSVLSTCNNGYCRLAMSQDGQQVYGSKHFGLETIWNRVDISSDDLARNKYIIGAYYIKFVLANKFLCITKNGDLFSSSEQVRGCLWFNQAPRLMSASYRNTNLVITANCRVGVEKGGATPPSINSNNNNGGLACGASTINITSGFSSELQSFFRTCQAQLIREPPVSSNKLKSSSSYQSAFKTAMSAAASFKKIEQTIDDSVPKSSSMLTTTPLSPLSVTVTQKKSMPLRGGGGGAATSRQMRKCFKLKAAGGGSSSVEYKRCLSKYYKCIKFSSDPQKLRQCRARNGINVSSKSRVPLSRS